MNCLLIVERPQSPEVPLTEDEIDAVLMDLHKAASAEGISVFLLPEGYRVSVVHKEP